MAASRTKFDVFFELDRYKADIFVRNREFKSVFQYVNCNQLMLKLVKKIERK
jgi:phosphatidylserine decarboxylase